MTAPKDIGSLPHWDMSTVFPSLESDEFKQAIETFKSQLTELEAYIQDNAINGTAPAPEDPQVLADTLGGYLVLIEQTARTQSTLGSYVSSFVSTDSYNTTAKRIMSELDILGLRSQKVNILAMGWIRSVAQNMELLEQALQLESPARQYAFFVRESAEQSKYQMSETEETLAAELSLSGPRGWAKLHKTLTSQASAPFTVNGETKELPATMIHNYLSSPDESLRKQSYEAEMKLW